jgi:hypothetical protein
MLSCKKMNELPLWKKDAMALKIGFTPSLKEKLFTQVKNKQK